MMPPPTVIPLDAPDPLEKVAHAADCAVFRPGLTLDEVKLLAKCPYEAPAAVSALPDAERKRVPALARQRLLETYSNGAKVKHARCTALGVEVVQAYAKGGFLGPDAKKHWQLVGQRLLLRRDA
jgi:hypothetical protein